MTTTAKIEARIAKHLETSATVREAVAAAAMEATDEARAMGWTEQTIRGMWITFANVAADMVVRAVAA